MKSKIKNSIINLTSRDLIHTILSEYNLNGNICEVGVREGCNFVHLIKCNPRLAVAVDIWKSNVDNIAQNDTSCSQGYLDLCYGNLIKRSMENRSLTIIREYSDKASLLFSDGFFDFIYLDADHTYDGVRMDIINWWPKVRPGGILAGHDYGERYIPELDLRFGVIPATNEFTMENKIELLISMDQSWFIIKE